MIRFLTAERDHKSYAILLPKNIANRLTRTKKITMLPCQRIRVLVSLAGLVYLPPSGKPEKTCCKSPVSLRIRSRKKLVRYMGKNHSNSLIHAQLVD